MEKQNGPRLAQDLSSLVASILPILQLFFTQLPSSVQGVFLAQKQFAGISLITLLLSYVFIIAFQAKPYFTIILPWQKKRAKKYNAYQSRLAQATASLNSVENPVGEKKTITKTLNEYIETLNEEPVDPPKRLERDNLVSLGVTIVVLASLAFIILAFMPYAQWTAVAQSVAYVLTIVFSVLILSVYRSTIQSSARYDEENNTKLARALLLARDNNVFGTLPNVRVVESFEAAGYPSNLNIVVEYNKDYYHIITDPAARRLIRGRKLDSYNENF